MTIPLGEAGPLQLVPIEARADMTTRDEDPDLPTELVSEILDHSLRALPEEDRPDAKRGLLEMLADIHRDTGAEFPSWLTTLLGEG